MAFAVNRVRIAQEKEAIKKKTFPALNISLASCVSFNKITPAAKPSINPIDSLRVGFLRATSSMIAYVISTP